MVRVCGGGASGVLLSSLDPLDSRRERLTFEGSVIVFVPVV
jgi:hypothetical protein